MNLFLQNEAIEFSELLGHDRKIFRNLLWNLDGIHDENWHRRKREGNQSQEFKRVSSKSYVWITVYKCCLYNCFEMKLQEAKASKLCDVINESNRAYFISTHYFPLPSLNMQPNNSHERVIYVKIRTQDWLPTDSRHFIT